MLMLDLRMRTAALELADSAEKRKELSMLNETLITEKAKLSDELDLARRRLLHRDELLHDAEVKLKAEEERRKILEAALPEVDKNSRSNAEIQSINEELDALEKPSDDK